IAPLDSHYAVRRSDHETWVRPIAAPFGVPSFVLRHWFGSLVSSFGFSQSLPICRRIALLARQARNHGRKFQLAPAKTVVSDRMIFARAARRSQSPQVSHVACTSA